MNKATRETVFSSERDDWQTPPEFWDWLDARYRFDADIDRCQPRVKGWGKKDALNTDWHTAGRVLYCNPPYGRQVDLWLAQGAAAARKGSTVVFLLPARTDTVWFHEYAGRADVYLVRGRLSFVGADAGAPFPSMLMVFGPGRGGVVKLLDWKGK